MADEAKKPSETPEIPLAYKEVGKTEYTITPSLVEKKDFSPEELALIDTRIDMVKKASLNLLKEKDALVTTKEKLQTMRAELTKKKEKKPEEQVGTLTKEEVEEVISAEDFEQITPPATPTPAPTEVAPPDPELLKAKEFFKLDPDVARNSGNGEKKGLFGGLNFKEMFADGMKNLKLFFLQIGAFFGKEVNMENEEAVSDGYENLADKKSTEAIVTAFKSYAGSGLDNIKTVPQKKELASLFGKAGLLASIEVKSGTKTIATHVVSYIFEGKETDTLGKVLSEDPAFNENIMAVRGKFLTLHGNNGTEGMSAEDKLKEVFTIEPEDKESYIIAAGGTMEEPISLPTRITRENAHSPTPAPDVQREKTLEEDLIEAKQVLKNAEGNNGELNTEGTKREVEIAKKKVEELKKKIAEKTETEKKEKEIEKTLADIQKAVEEAKKIAISSTELATNYANTPQDNKTVRKEIKKQIIENLYKIFKEEGGSKSGLQVDVENASILLGTRYTSEITESLQAIKNSKDNIEKALTDVSIGINEDLPALNPYDLSYENLLYDDKKGKIFEFAHGWKNNGPLSLKKYELNFREVKYEGGKLFGRADSADNAIPGNNNVNLIKQGYAVIRKSDVMSLLNDPSKTEVGPDKWGHLTIPPQYFAGKLHPIKS